TSASRSLWMISSELKRFLGMVQISLVIVYEQSIWISFFRSGHLSPRAKRALPPLRRVRATTT
ncbi:hypothetical protein, partial [Lysobacter sp. CA199]|uniref:hypothetical protein n=1 Tax=Lysobacter sp. CA199 TaxID=3455608 RepID=UPI003F8D828B